MAHSTGVRMKSEFVLGKIKSSKEVMNLISHLRRCESSEVAKERLRIISFYDIHGESAAKEAFGVDRKVIYIWRKRVKARKGLQGLVPDSTAPRRVRRSAVDPKIVEYIRAQREFVPKMSKKKLKPLLDAYCKKNNLPTMGEATIGRVIKRNNLFFYKTGRVYHNPNSKWAQNEARRRKKHRIKYAPKPESLGYIQLDTVEKIIDGSRWYMYQAIDVRGKSALSLTYRHLNSANTVDFFKKFQSLIPYKIHTVQTDNGKEFLKHFRDYLQKQNIKHIFIYPRMSKVQGVVERFNRTLTEDFIDPSLHLICNQPEYNRKLAKYLIYYNCLRIHESLNNMTPTQYLIQEGGMSNMLRSYTSSCISKNLYIKYQTVRRKCVVSIVEP